MRSDLVVLLPPALDQRICEKMLGLDTLHDLLSSSSVSKSVYKPALHSLDSECSSRL